MYVDCCPDSFPQHLSVNLGYKKQHIVSKSSKFGIFRRHFFMIPLWFEVIQATGILRRLNGLRDDSHLHNKNLPIHMTKNGPRLKHLLA